MLIVPRAITHTHTHTHTRTHTHTYIHTHTHTHKHAYMHTWHKMDMHFKKKSLKFGLHSKHYATSLYCKWTTHYYFVYHNQSLKT